MPAHKLPDKNFKWSPKLAYVVGLLATDGNLSSDGRHIIMRSSDTELLKTFNNCLGIHNKIGQSKNRNVYSYRVQYGSVQFYRWLLKIGLFPAKTYSIGKLKIPNVFFRDFLRGHLDGDGTITAYKDRYNTFKNPKYIYQRFFVRFISASKQHILWLQNKAMKILKVNGRVHKAKPANPEKQVAMWILKFGKKETIKLLSQLYYKKDLPCLERKRKIAVKFI